MGKILKFSIALCLVIASVGIYNSVFLNTAYAATTLYARVLNDATIDLKFADGTKVTTLPAGAYTIQVTDSTVDHNFHLTGTGVNQTTSVSGLTTTTWQVTLSPGTYTYICDPHPSWMRGSFTVTSAQAATPTPTPTPTPNPVVTTSSAHTGHTAAPTSKFSIGDPVVSLSNLNVRYSASVTGLKAATMLTGSTGTIQEIAGPTDGYIWVKVKYSNGLIGWSVQDWLSKTSSLVTSQPSLNFLAGDTIATTEKLRVRTSASLSGGTLAITALGERGTILIGPTPADGYIWWKIQFSNGLVGWSVGNWLQKNGSGTVPTTPINSNTFAPGNTIVALSNLRVRTSPTTAGGLVGTASYSAIGTVIDGSAVTADGYVWRKIQFSSGLTGWAADAFLGAPGAPGSPGTSIPIPTPLPPVITSSYPANPVVGIYYAYQITASNSVTNFSATSLPPGLSINQSTGLISGTPYIAGDYPITFSASNGGGMVTNRMTLTVLASGSVPPTTNSGNPTILVARVLNDATIDLKYQNGSAVTSIPAGNYTIQVDDQTSAHNFHLTGPGIDQTTSVAGTGTATWQVNLTQGTYTFLCDPHASWMRGTFTVTSATGQNPATSSQPPQLSGTPSFYGTVGTYYSYQPTVSNNPTSFSATSLPPGLSVNTSTGLISGVPTSAGNYLSTITAANSAGTGSMTFSLIISSSSSNPPTSGSGTTLYARVLGDTTIDLKYQNGTPVTSLTAGSYTIQVDDQTSAHNFHLMGPGIDQTTTVSGTGTATWQVTFTAGSYEYVCDPHDAWMRGTFTVAGGSSVSAPSITSSQTSSATAGSSYSYQIGASNSPTSFSASGLPSGVSVNTSTGLISGTPSAAGVYTVNISATNSGGTGSASLTVTIASGSSPAVQPSITSSTMQSGTVGSSYSYQITASNSPTSFSASSLPAGLSVNASTGVISGTPTQAGSYTVTISASNAGGTGSATRTLSIASSQQQSPPSITSSLSSSATAGTAYSYQITASNSPTSYSASGLPSGLSVNSSTGIISGTPASSGTYTMTIFASNSAGTGSSALTITIASAPAGGTVLQARVINSSTIDIKLNGVNVTSLPAGNYTIQVTDSTSSHNFHLTGPGVDQTTSVSGTSNATWNVTLTAGTYTFVCDPHSGSMRGTFTVTSGSGGGSAPSIVSSLNSSGTAGTAYTYQISALNNPTSYSASGLPSGLTLNTSSGLISGTPSAAGNYTVSLSASNASGTGTATLAITVSSAVVKPAITSALTSSGTSGSAYSYQITASNNPTSFSASGLPSGVSINSTSGLISGTPSASGTYSATISASNSAGAGTATLTITIASAPSGGTVLQARVINSSTIDIKLNGVNVTSLPAGNYTIQVTDSTSSHNFHLTGPGVNQTTSVSATTNATWQVTLTAGTYTYVCDPHSDSMRGTFTVQ